MKVSLMILGVLMLVALPCLWAVEPNSLENEADYNQYLINSLKNENIGIRVSAAQLLGERKAIESRPALIEMLSRDKRYEARIIAVWALRQIGDNQSLEALEKHLKKESNETVKHVLTGAILELSQKEVATL
jgi:HEAT repeat protein